ncbi:MAG: hypothetical protein ACI4LC_01840 [Emergencia sp.]
MVMRTCKVVLSLSLTMLFVLLSTTVGFCDTSVNETLRQAPDVFSEQNIEQVELLKRNVESYLREKISD